MKIGWNYGEIGAGLSATLAVIGTFITSALGGWDIMVQTLIWFMVADFIIGFIAAMKLKKVDSQVMLWGGVNKLLVFVLVALATRLDILLALQNPYIRTAVIWFYIGREGLSLVENYGKMGLPLPTFIKTMLKQIADQADKGEKNVTDTETTH